MFLLTSTLSVLPSSLLNDHLFLITSHGLEKLSSKEGLILLVAIRTTFPHTLPPTFQVYYLYFQYQIRFTNTWLKIHNLNRDFTIYVHPQGKATPPRKILPCPPISALFYFVSTVFGWIVINECRFPWAEFI